MHVTESYGSSTTGEVIEYVENQTNCMVQQKSHLKHRHNVGQFLKAVFLPQGYPESVSQDYFTYQVWDTLQAFCSSITGTLATHAVLTGSGVGDEAATVTAATLTWLLKDGTGMVGRIAFAYFYGTSLDANAKQWRLFADLLNDCAICVQLLAPLLPKVYFTPIMCTAGLAFSLVGVAGGCTRAALTMHQAKRNNMADVSAKDGSQETLANLAGLLTSLMITPYLSQNLPLTWMLFFLFTVLHIYSNYQAVSCVVMETFNRIRFETAIESFISNKNLSPISGNRKETVLFPSSFPWLKLGCKLEELKMSPSEFDLALTNTKENDTRFILVNRKGYAYVALESKAETRHILMACYYSFLLHRGLEPHFTDCHKFLHLMESSGWDLTKHHLCADEWRWSTSASDLPNQIKQKVI